MNLAIPGRIWLRRNQSSAVRRINKLMLLPALLYQKAVAVLYPSHQLKVNQHCHLIGGPLDLLGAQGVVGRKRMLVSGDETLMNAVRVYNGKNWKKIAEFFPGKSELQCLHRWQKVLHPELVKGPWTQEEHDKIIEMVSKHGPRKWSLIAKSLPGRIGKQCRERWCNHLNPDIKKDPWTLEEELALMDAHCIHGNK